MPELPELETYRTLLSERIVGKTISAVEVSREKTINVAPDLFEKSLLGTKCNSINRRGKHLIFRLATGQALLLHLMLGGFMYYGSKEDKLQRTAQVTLTFGRDQLFFHGLRLGFLHLLNEAELLRELSNLGPEPFDPTFTLSRFDQMLGSKKGALKSALVDQQFIAGIGNCYADEICFAAGVLPKRKIPTLSLGEVAALYQAISNVLQEATRLGGYMERPLYHGDSFTGGYNVNCKVYDRPNEPCLRCGHPIVQDELSSRKVFYCPQCQK